MQSKKNYYPPDTFSNSWSQVLLLALILSTGVIGVYLDLPTLNHLIMIIAMLVGLVTALFYYRQTNLHVHNDTELFIDIIFSLSIFAFLFSANQYAPWFMFWFYVLIFADAMIYNYRRLLFLLTLLSTGLIAYLYINAAILTDNQIILIFLNIFTLWVISHYMWIYAKESQAISMRGQKAIGQVNYLKELNVQRSEFLHLASHQIKNPLAIIRFILGDLLTEEKLTKKCKQSLEQAMFQSETVIDFFDDITRIVKAENASEAVSKEPTDLEVLVKEIFNELHHLIDQKKIQITKHVGGVLPKINTDPIYLKIAITNLIDNAIKYSKNNSRINILISEILSKSKEGFIEIKVQDHGIGISQADRIRIFEKFFRGANAKNQVPNGTGLGLYLTKLILERLNGEINFTSSLNKGSEFTILIPY